MTTIASDSGHWYDQQGQPAYTVTGKNGKERPTTKRDARQRSLVPSVTMIMREADAPALNIYRVKQTLLAGASIPRDPSEGDEEWMARVLAKSKEHAETARDIGTAIHGSIERWLCGKYPDTTYAHHIDGAMAALSGWCGLDELRPERSFAHPLGFGGKCDIHKKPAIDIKVNHPGFVADFKSKDFTADKLPDVYENHAMQFAAYREGFDMPSARGAIIYVSTSVPGLTHLVELSEDELMRGWNMFVCLLRYWQHKNRYGPQPKEIAA